MANHRPLVRIEGDTHVLPEGDTLPVGVIEGAVGDDDPRLSDAREWTAATVSQEEAEDGTATTRRAWTAQRVRQAIVAWWNGSADKTKLDGIATGATANQSDAYLLSRANHTGTQAQSTITGLTTDLAAKADKATTITAGTGLTGGGDLSANRSFAVSYGTTAGTAAEGNDSRLSNSREWTASTISQAEAEAGTATTRRAFTAQRVRQAIVAWWTTIGTTVGNALLNLANPGAVRFIRINADNTVTARSDSEMRSDLGLGTAATATITTSDTDTTAGRVVKVGDYGIGVGTTASGTTGVDYNTYRTPGVYLMSTPSGGEPANAPPINNAVLLFVRSGTVSSSNNRVIQDALSYSAGGSIRAFARSYNGTSWGAWHENFALAPDVATARTNLGVIAPDSYYLTSDPVGVQITHNKLIGTLGSDPSTNTYVILQKFEDNSRIQGVLYATKGGSNFSPNATWLISGSTANSAGAALGRRSLSAIALSGGGNSGGSLVTLTVGGINYIALELTVTGSSSYRAFYFSGVVRNPDDLFVVLAASVSNVTPYAGGTSNAVSLLGTTLPASNISGLGTAATATITTSTTDYTAGRVMRVGDFGVGVPPAVVSAPDWNTFTSPGFYRINGVGTNGPLSSFGTAADWNLLVMGNAAGALTQFAFSADAYQYVATRNQMSGGAWTSWRYFQFLTTTYTGNRVALTSSGGAITESPVTNVELGYLAGVTSQVSFRVAVPATPTSPGVAGTWAADATHLYHCYATNTWRRVAHSTW